MSEDEFARQVVQRGKLSEGSFINTIPTDYSGDDNWPKEEGYVYYNYIEGTLHDHTGKIITKPK